MCNYINCSFCQLLSDETTTKYYLKNDLVIRHLNLVAPSRTNLFSKLIERATSSNDLYHAHTVWQLHLLKITYITSFIQHRKNVVEPTPSCAGFIPVDYLRELPLIFRKVRATGESVSRLAYTRASS